MASSIIDALVNYNPQGFALRNQDLGAQVQQRQAAAEGQQAQTDQERIKTQGMQIQLRDQQILNDAFRRSGGNPMQTAQYAIQGGISPQGFYGFRNGDTEFQTKLATLNKDNLANYATTNEQVAGVYAGLQALPREQRAQAIPEAMQRIYALDPTHAVPDPQSLLDDATIQSKLGTLNYEKTRLAQAKEQADTSKATAEGVLAQAKAPGAAAESQKQQMVAKAMQDAMSDPQSGAKLIDGALPPALDSQANSSYKSAWQAAMQSGNLEGAAHIVAAAAGHASQISMANNPLVAQGKANEAATVERATAPVKISTAVGMERATSGFKIAQAVATAKALRAGDNPAVAGVAPASIGQVQNAAMKLDQEAINAKAVTDSMGRLLDLAEKGNKAAGSNLPLVGVETLNAINGIKRINGAEISQYGSAGNLLDQLQGKLGKLTTGQPIPQDVLNDIRELHQSVAEQSRQKYVDGLNSLNARTGAKFTPSVDAPNIRKAPAAAGPAATAGGALKIGQPVTLRNGKTVKVTAVHPDGSFDAQ